MGGHGKAYNPAGEKQYTNIHLQTKQLEWF